MTPHDRRILTLSRMNHVPWLIGTAALVAALYAFAVAPRCDDSHPVTIGSVFVLRGR
jgi:hypothetical protein